MSSTDRSPAAERTSRISLSAVGASRWAVGSSSTSTGASASSARASDEPLPLPAGQLAALLAHERVQSLREVATQCHSRARRSASSTSASLASGRASRTFSRMVAENRCDVLAGDGDHAADVFLAVVAQVSPAERDAPALGVEEAEQQVDHRRLAGAARPQRARHVARARGAG